MKRALCGLAASLLTMCLLLAACSSNVDTPEAVRQGIVNDLSKRMDVKNMDVSVDSVSFRDKEADALVSFAPKGAPRSQGMTMRYKMQRSGNEWHIASRSSGDLQRHQQSGAPGQSGGEMNGQLPPGHPTVGGAMGGGDGANNPNLPAGHPAIQPGPSR